MTSGDSHGRLSLGARRVLLALVDVVCPGEARELALGPAIVEHLELGLQALPGEVRASFIAGLFAYDVAALLRHGRRSHKLELDRARRYFAFWCHRPGPVGEFAKAVKGLLCLAHYEMPAIKEAIDYRPQDWIDRVKKRRLGRYPDDIRRHQAALFAADPLPETLLAALARRPAAETAREPGEKP